VQRQPDEVQRHPRHAGEPRLRGVGTQTDPRRSARRSGAGRRSRRAVAACAAALAATLALAGCGGHATTVADCLDARGFLVQEHDDVVRGSSAGGVAFTLTVFSAQTAARRAFGALPRSSGVLVGDAVVDDAGNPPIAPGQAPGTLSRVAIATIRLCLADPGRPV
jgi:hypothetical protein